MNIKSYELARFINQIVALRIITYLHFSKATRRKILINTAQAKIYLMEDVFGGIYSNIHSVGSFRRRVKLYSYQ